MGCWYLNKEPFDIGKFFSEDLGRRITFLFILVGIIAPAMGIYYFYLISASTLTQNSQIFAEQSFLLRSTAVLIIVLTAINSGILGYFVSRSITKPIKKLHDATLEVEKGNFDVRVDIETEDEIAQLGNAINKGVLALGKMEEERKQLDRAKSEFLSMISHELRTPITPMMAQLQMLQEEYFGILSDKQKESLKIIIRNAQRLNKIVEDFLEISRIETARLKFNFKRTNLKDIINETIGFMNAFAKGKNIQLMVNADDLPIIEVDPDRVSQVLRNLIHNAIKYSKNYGKVEISAIPKQDHILFSVKDCGVGMTPVDQIRVFEPFFQIEETLKREYGGTGLGLAICRGIVESQKGKIWVESKLGEGSNFFFTIPLAPLKDIEPIKVLFSPKAVIERKIKEAFTATLGPIGVPEFNDLKSKNSLGKEDIFGYIDLLENQCILSSKNAGKFKLNIGRIFGDSAPKIEDYKIDKMMEFEVKE